MTGPLKSVMGYLLIRKEKKERKKSKDAWSCPIKVFLSADEIAIKLECGPHPVMNIREYPSRGHTV